MRSFNDWLALVNEYTLSIGGLAVDEMPQHYPLHYWWSTRCSPRWTARQLLGMDNG